ncbi:HAD-IIIA family hydrolase [Luteimonas sp. MC1572]|uniref:KdsC family phosphatase n=1 Tax=Luteimonas sp. MC1572 TaxID=2799325 RepID=UPI0018F080BC|nr:HAD-IIIA family hydrolase [Luteimonas sp. MC1572]MBJ6982507.1 HAD-IIIA family hydrolase [Luteimonas sp. MC1572]QQO03763.1 HAD-IIIA family hydrolase [Luteimonas sp. MC1572]
MPPASPAPVSTEVLARAARVRLACFDVDGTLTDGRLYIGDDGRETKAFHVHDGMGLSLLRRAGIAVAFVTARDSRAAEHRARDLGVDVHVGVKDKRACIESMRERLGLAADQVAFMGDDLTDLEVLAAVGFAAAPGNAHPSILGHVHWQAMRRGGEGAAREFCDLVLSAIGAGGGAAGDMPQ